jgi:hypothetical protein
LTHRQIEKRVDRMQGGSLAKFANFSKLVVPTLFLFKQPKSFSTFKTKILNNLKKKKDDNNKYKTVPVPHPSRRNAYQEPTKLKGKQTSKKKKKGKIGRTRIVNFLLLSETIKRKA